MAKSDQFCTLGKAVIETEIAAIQQLLTQINENFSAACHSLLGCQGRVIVLGMGKSGHIGKKIAATFASTGTPAFFVHPSEASHGDLGMITAKDVVLALSNSGETPEIVNLLPLIKRIHVPLISLTGNPQSTLSQTADINLDISVHKEACPLGLAPTSSTTTTLVMGDALAIALLEARGFTADDFARFHPGGALGKRLLLHVSDLMHTGNAIPQIVQDSCLQDAILEMNAKRLGVTTVVDSQAKLVGIFTDGDLRRAFENTEVTGTTPIKQIMTQHTTTITASMLAFEALQIMREKKITSLIITNEQQQPTGIIHMHDLLQAGVN